MKIEVTATIQSISEVVTGDNGHKRLTFRAQTSEEYSQLSEVGMYKKSEYAEHVDNFVKYNKVGDVCKLELTIRVNEHNNKLYTNLQLWKCDKLEASNDLPAPPPIGSDDPDSLPF